MVRDVDRDKRATKTKEYVPLHLSRAVPSTMEGEGGDGFDRTSIEPWLMHR